MSAELVKHQATAVTTRGGALSLSVMSPHEAWLFCQSLADTPLLPDAYRRNPASVLWAMEYGRALGLDVVTTINTIHVIKGKPTQSADLMLSRAREAGHKVRIRQEPGSCTASIWRSDDPEFENSVTWTYDDAVTASLCEMRNGRPYSRSQKGEKQNWEKYPRAMLRARAISECVRTACPEVLHGAIYTPEELGARVDAEGLPVEAEVHQLRRVQQGEQDPWATPGPQQREDSIPPEQAYADTAGTTTDQAAVKELYRQAHAAGLLAVTVKVGDETQELGAYLIARGQQLAQPAPGNGDEKKDGGDGIPDAVVVSEGETEADIAERELRAAAARAGLDNLDEEFERSYGLPIREAGSQQLREMTALLTGTAA